MSLDGIKRHLTAPPVITPTRFWKVRLAQTPIPKPPAKKANNRMLDYTQTPPMTSDLELALRLKQMPRQTLYSTTKSLRKLRETIATGSDLSIDAVRDVVTEPDPALRCMLGAKATQVFSDARRALRVWDEPAIQKLAVKLRGTVVTCEHAIDAAYLDFPPDRAKRAEGAIRALAKHLNQPVDAIIATETVIEPKLVALVPEDLAVGSVQSLNNKKTLIRAAVSLVDPARVHGAQVDTTRISEAWRPTLDILLSRAPEHSPAVAAIFRRLALVSDTEAKAPEDLTKTDLAIFVQGERQTHNFSFGRKLGMAMKLWNESVEDSLFKAVPFDRSRRVQRLPDVAWESVPAAIREPLDTLLGQASTADRSGGVWEDAIEDDLGVPDAHADDQNDRDLTVNPATAELWRRSFKRVWHAAAHDNNGTPEPKTIEALFTPQSARSFVTALWACRKKKLDEEGKDWESNKKGIYEAGLLKTFVAAGAALGVEESQLCQIRAFIHKIDPTILAKKKMPDGRIAFVYDEIKIGPRHAEMLRAFNQDSVMSRWFKAPDQLWTEAMKGKSRNNGVNGKDVALARSALILRIMQRVSPLRRKSLARLRIYGAQPHIHLPIGKGEGRLYLPAIEMKNLRALEVRIDPETVCMIREFVSTFRPVSLARAMISAENEHLFPGSSCARPELGADREYPAGFGYHSLDSFGQTYAQHMRGKFALNVDMHVARHIAAKVILDMDPSAMGLVQEVLEHKKIETTRAYYASVSKIIAQKRYLQLLDQATRRAIGKIDFTIFFEDQLGN